MFYSLNELKPGMDAMISHLEGEVNLRCRLSELGFVPGAQVHLVAKMPFKGPIVVQTHGAKIALRYEYIKNIFVCSSQKGEEF